MNCPTCNRSSDECRFIGDFCEFCAADTVKRQTPESIDVEQCRWCGRIRLKGVYRPMDKASIGESIESEMKTHGWNVDVVSMGEKDVQAKFYCNVEGVPISFENNVHLKISHRTCTDCYRKSSGYYEAIVQLRGDAGKVERLSESISKFIEKRKA